MSQGDGKPGGPAGPDDPLSATGMFLDAFRGPSEEPQSEAQESFLKAAKPLSGPAEPAGPGEFTRLFGALDPVAPVPHPAPPPSAPPREAPKQSWEEATRIFAAKAAPLPEPVQKPVVSPVPVANPPRMKGFSSPGASDSASDEGSFTQVFRTISGTPAASPQVRPIQPLPPQVSSPPPPIEKAEWPSSSAKSPGATDLLRALSTADASQTDRNTARPEPAPNSVFAAVESGSVTNWMKKLSEEVEPQPAAVTPPTAIPPPPAASSPGEFTRIMNADAGRAAGGAPAPAAPSFSAPAFSAPAAPAAPKVQMPAIEPPKVAAPKAATPAVPAPKSKLQEMLPILLVLNSFLLVVLIVLVVFVLLRK